jgi:hypothetical protein
MRKDPEPKSFELRAVCVYCGSSPGHDPRYIEAATAFGTILGRNGVTLVYGGGSNGLMGAVARATLDAGGRVIGIIPEFLKKKERMLTDAQELIVVPDMHTRKRMMFERSDAFVALPGGVGTLEELVEQLTWAQLGQHRKPIALANLGGFWSPLRDMLDHMREAGFIHDANRVGYIVTDHVDDILPRLRAAVCADIAQPLRPEL